MTATIHMDLDMLGAYTHAGSSRRARVECLAGRRWTRFALAHAGIGYK